jgi:predicted nucleotidyltransferase
VACEREINLFNLKISSKSGNTRKERVTSNLSCEMDIELRMEIQKQIVVPCKLLVIAFSGSQAYNLTTKNSDQDLVAVYVVPLRKYLRLQRDYVETSFGSFHLETKHDYTIREITAFSLLLLESNPNIIESLYFTNLSSDSDHWKELCSKRNLFLTTKFLSKCSFTSFHP